MNKNMPASTSSKNLINGITADYLNINDRAIHYGDGLFETILCADQKIYFWQSHYQRLSKSAEKLKIKCPQEYVLLGDIKKCLSENAGPCAIKIILTRGNGKRGYKYDKNMHSNRLVMVSDIEPDHSSLLCGKLLSGDLFLCEQQVSINKNLAGLKHLNRIDNVLARNEWGDAASTNGKTFIDGLMLNHNSHIIEGTMSNVFAVKDDVLITPDLSLSGVDGILRQEVIKQAAKVNIDTVVEDIKLDELMNADELFISNSLIGLKSVYTFNDRIFDDTKVTKTIFDEVVNSLENNAENIK